MNLVSNLPAPVLPVSQTQSTGPTPSQLPVGRPDPLNAFLDKPPLVARLAGGALSGYVIYWIFRLIDKVGGGVMSNTAPIRPIPYVLAGVAMRAIIETAKLAHSAALSVMGKRSQYENLAAPQNASAFDRLRSRSWKIVSGVEKIHQKIDAIFSRVFKVRTAKEIRDNKIADRQLVTMEIFRLALSEQVKSTATSIVPMELGIYAVEALGYTFAIGHISLLFIGLNFVSGIILNAKNFVLRVAAEIEEEKKKLAEEVNKLAEEETTGVTEKIENPVKIENLVIPKQENPLELVTEKVI